MVWWWGSPKLQVVSTLTEALFQLRGWYRRPLSPSLWPDLGQLPTLINGHKEHRKAEPSYGCCDPLDFPLSCQAISFSEAVFLPPQADDMWQKNPETWISHQKPLSSYWVIQKPGEKILPVQSICWQPSCSHCLKILSRVSHSVGCVHLRKKAAAKLGIEKMLQGRWFERYYKPHDHSIWLNTWLISHNLLIKIPLTAGRTFFYLP